MRHVCRHVCTLGRHVRVFTYFNTFECNERFLEAINLKQNEADPGVWITKMQRRIFLKRFFNKPSRLRKARKSKALDGDPLCANCKQLEPQVIISTAAGGDIDFQGVIMSVLKADGTVQEFNELLKQNNKQIVIPSNYHEQIILGTSGDHHSKKLSIFSHFYTKYFFFSQTCTFRI